MLSLRGAERVGRHFISYGLGTQRMRSQDPRRSIKRCLNHTRDQPRVAACFKLGILVAPGLWFGCTEFQPSSHRLYTSRNLHPPKSKAQSPNPLTACTRKEQLSRINAKPTARRRESGRVRGRGRGGRERGRKYQQTHAQQQRGATFEACHV